MLQDHLLLSRAHRFPPASPAVGNTWRYRRDVGAWVESERPDSLMVAPVAGKPGEKPRPRPDPVPTSKKADHETGEDMKGA